MSTISKERLEQLASGNAWVCVQDDEAAELARIALASLEAEPVAWLLSGGGAKNNVSFDSGNAYPDPLREVTPLYAAPPAPISVPAAMEMDDDFDSAFEHGKAVGWNAYRAAMLQGAEPVSRSDAIDASLIEALRLIQCMLEDYRERNYGDAERWIRHIDTHMSDYTESHGDDAYSILHDLLTAAPQQEVTQALAKGMERYGDAMQKLADSGD
ncbi:hypothetical protein [Enterobacter cloacae]|uniref:hypothetical protein n=1 Tax=Enterobacter cloacae TaxID=550 RepID=UPI0021BE7C9B|nr:hypothetical protein [Enterobacter cloacae]UXL11369.1 hypothetical protein N7S94_05180 [Enterobacter cloacae]